MKVSNETKIGALTAISITLLILGFNYLKGKNLLSKADTEIFAVFQKVDGLANSNAVTINGLQVGKIQEMKERNRNLDGIVVAISLSKDIIIPRNSFATINKDLLGTATVAITLGDAPEEVRNGDTLLTRFTAGIIDDVKAALNPTLAGVNGAVTSLDSLLEVIGTYFDPNTKNNFHTIIGNLTRSTANLQKLLDTQTGALAMTLGNVNSFTGNLAKNNEKINTTLANLETTTGKFANLKVEEAVTSLNESMSELKVLIAKANSNNGSIGLLLNDPKLYRNLESTTYKLNILLDDLRVNPKRYVNVSVFGRKNSGQPLTSPLKDDTTNLPLQKK
ncbi:MAG: MCE family protein [Gemmatimonadaceae bacterium]|nr:MCE family protein [Chitinophagaceae bacterium]